jgi:hypothetical protein
MNPGRDCAGLSSASPTYGLGRPVTRDFSAPVRYNPAPDHPPLSYPATKQSRSAAGAARPPAQRPKTRQPPHPFQPLRYASSPYSIPGLAALWENARSPAAAASGPQKSSPAPPASHDARPPGETLPIATLDGEIYSAGNSQKRRINVIGACTFPHCSAITMLCGVRAMRYRFSMFPGTDNCRPRCQ